jgi:hypothetical protein
MKKNKLLKFIKFAFATQFAFGSNLALASNSLPSIMQKNNNSKLVVLVMAPQANLSDYQSRIQNSKNYISFVDFQIERIINNESQQEQVFSLAEKIEIEPQLVINKIEQLISKEPLTQVSLNFITDFSEKYLSRKTNASEKEYFLNLICKNSLLTKSSIPESCKRSNMNMSLLKRKWPEAEKILIESQSYLTTETGPEIISGMKYHWTLLSNSSKSLSFYGTYDQLLAQGFNFDHIVNGSDTQYTSNIDDLEVNATGFVFFSKDCIKPINQPIVRNGLMEWASNNKGWLIPVSLIVVGAAALNLQNKKLIIEKPH